MTPLQRQFALREKGSNQNKIAAAIGVKPISVSNVINGQRVSDRIMRAIADVIGDDVRLVFPEYYLRPAKRSTSKISQFS